MQSKNITNNCELSNSGNSQTRILFFSSGEFAIPTFENLLKNNYNVVGLVTSNDKMTFKNKTQKRLIDLANEYNIPILNPYSNNDTVNSETSYNWIKEKNADVFCVISYKKLSDNILSLANRCAFNVHASILPYLKGAAPINHALRLNFKETGLTAFVLNDKIDCGDIITSEICKIEDTDNFESLYFRLSNMCVNFTQNIIDNFNNDISYPTVTFKQSTPVDFPMFKAPKIKSDYLKNWKTNLDVPYAEIPSLIRSVNPIDGLYIRIVAKDKNTLQPIKEFEGKIFDVDINTAEEIDYLCKSKLLTDGKTYFKILLDEPFANEGWMYIKEIQLAGKKKLKIEDFLRGFKTYIDKYEISVYDY